MLLAALFMPWAAQAQEELTVCDGTTTNNYIPFYGSYVDTQGCTCEFIIPAETEGMSDMEGGTISKLTFYISGTPQTWGSPTIQVYMGEVEGATLSGINGPANFTTVYTGIVSNQTNPLVIELSDAYTYEGGNLLIGTYVQTASSTYKSTPFYGVSAPSGSSYYHSGSSYGTATAQSFLPKTTFTYEPAQSGGDVCEKPATLVAEDVTGNSATLTWTGGSGVYNIELNGTIIEENYEGYTYSLTDLAATTAYTAKVQSVCDGTTPTSGWKSVSFTTPCASYDIPYTYGFEDAAPFACWTVISGNITRINGTPNTGSYRLDFRGTNSNMIALPQFNEATNNLRVEFWTRPESTGGNSGKFAIGYMTDITDASTFVAVETYNSTEMTTTYVMKTVDFVNVPADANIAMRQFDCSTNYYWFVDDVTVKAIPSCIAPTDLAANATTTSAELSWTANSGETAWTLYWKKTSDESYTEVANVTANPYTLNGLTAATNYQYYVVANCAADDASEPSATFTFATACDAVTTFPWSEDFESFEASSSGITFNAPCWVNEHISGNGSYFFEVYSGGGYSGSNSTKTLRLHDMSNGTLTKLMLPEMTLPGDNYLFSIDVFRNASGSSYTSEGVRVFVSADGEIEGATELAFLYRNFTQTDGNLIPAESASGWYTYELPIPMSGTCYIILRGESQYGSATYMDNFAVMQAPTCMKPTNLTQTHTNHSATLNWTAGNEGQNAWQIAYSTTSFNPNAADFDLTTVEVIDNVEETSYTFDKTLDANTHYYMYVRGNCGDEDYSKWVGIDFTTGTANPSPTVTTVDEITPVSAVLRWTAAGGDYLESYDIYYSQTSGAPAAGADSLIQYKGIDAGFTSYILQNLTEGYWYVYMRAYHGETDGYSSWTPYYGYSFQVPEACPEPTGLAASDPTPNSITLTWTEGAEWQYAWKVAYSTNPEFNPEEMDPETFVDVFGQQGPTITCTVNNLESETTYYFKVLGNCNNPYGDSDWTDAVSETTLVACPVPTDLNVTVAQTSATLNWNGYSDSYTVQYRTAGGYDVELVEGFESGSMPAGWTIEGDNQVSTKTWRVGVGDNNSTTGTHDGNYNALITHDSYDEETYLITPAMDFSVVSEASLNLWYINRSWAGDTDEFGVYYRVNGGEWNELFSTTEAHSTWTELNLTLTGLAANTQIGFKCYDNYGYGIGLDDITILGGEYNEPGEWIAIENVEEETITIEGLEFGTKYDAQVKANCGEEYCDYITFTTNALKTFTTEGDWSVAANWTPAGVPTIEDVVSIEAPATISQIAYANEITVANGGSITIADGGQLQHNNAGVTATVKKTINGYTVDNYETNNGYYFIANPLTTSVYPEEAGLITDDNNDYYTYDLYDWAPTFSEEWRNYRDGEFSTLSYNNTPAYLYANMNTVELAFTGTVRPSQNRVSTTVYVSNNQFGAWNLIGNPFVCNAYLVDNNGNALPYYRMNEAGNGFDAVTGEAIAPVTGIFYEAPAYGQVYFTREAPANGDKGVLNMNLRSNNKQLDNAIVRFGEGQQMSKFSFRENSTKVYIPMDGIDYAVVNAGQVGEVPVSFKAEKNGSFTMNVTSDEVSFSYLHLIDNMTGADVDLLANPTYSFNASTTDYESRFRLVFATGSSVADDNFAFINGAGNLSIFGIEGTATLQVMDVNGRVLSTETFSGSYEKSLNVAAGVYMLRLINGDNVKVQKVVVR